MADGKELDVARRAKMIEGLKTELVGDMARLYQGLWEGNQTTIVDGLASLILRSYLLARRIGVPYWELDNTIKEMLKAQQQGDHQGNHLLEDWYGDLTSLERHLDGR